MNLISKIPPFWGFLIAALIFLVIYEASPRVGGILLIVLVLAALINYEKRQNVST